mgnify:CR=1 FL=1
MPKRFIGSVPRPASKRFRVSVPEVDESVLAWIGAQSDLSASVRALIREAIERNGYRDATCYPVVQQPRRGRPPKQSFDDEVEVDEPRIETGDKIVGTVDAGYRDVLTPSTREGIGVNKPIASDDDTKSEMTIADLSSVEDVFGSLR